MRNNIKPALMCSLIAFLTGCASQQPSEIYPSTVRGSDYNSISEQYTTMQTRATIDSGMHGEKYLIYRTKLYSFGAYGQDIFMLDINKENAFQVIANIDKFLKWESIAVKDGDEFDKDIGTAKEVLGGNTYKFSFHSGNKQDHYLSVSWCAPMVCPVTTGYFDKANAIKLKEEISRYISGEYRVADTSKYQ